MSSVNDNQNNRQQRKLEKIMLNQITTLSQTKQKKKNVVGHSCCVRHRQLVDMKVFYEVVILLSFLRALKCVPVENPVEVVAYTNEAAEDSYFFS